MEQNKFGFMQFYSQKIEIHLLAPESKKEKKMANDNHLSLRYML